MNFIQRLSGLFGSKVEVRNKFNEAFFWGSGGYTQYDNKGQTYLNEGYNKNPFVYSMINQQASKSASIPFSVKKIKDSDSMGKLRQLHLATKGDYTVQQHVKKAVLETKAFEEKELPFPMERPNINQSWKEFVALYKTFLKLTGNVYIYILSPSEGMNAGQPLQVYLLPSHQTQIILKPNTNLLGVENPIDHYILIQGNGYIEFEQSNVIHIKYSNPNFGENGEHLYGQSPLRAALRNIQSSNTALDLNIKVLKSGGAFGFIHAKNTPLQPTQAAEIKERLAEMDASPENLSKIAGISAEIGFTRLSLTSDELKPFDFLKFDREQIAAVLNWTVDDDNRGDFGGTINEIRKMRITDNIMPDLDLLAMALNTEFLPRFKGYDKTVIQFDYSELPEMQTDLKELVLWLKDALDRGVINRNEFRMAIRYPESKDSDMDIYTVNTDIMSLDEVLNPDFGVNNNL